MTLLLSVLACEGGGASIGLYPGKDLDDPSESSPREDSPPPTDDPAPAEATLCPSGGPWRVSWSGPYGQIDADWGVEVVCADGVASALIVEPGPGIAAIPLQLTGTDLWSGSVEEQVEEAWGDDAWVTTLVVSIELGFPTERSLEGTEERAWSCGGGDCGDLWDSLYRGGDGQAVESGPVWGAPR